ncbi:uncharacterized protein si:ch211-266a5.12 [Triplophysa rosa]|uniref:Uncharacterized protein n=1 Tax=Triplophysa rosa TaxID=992332 RepID=A0A9W7T7C9_TRIRA|nr:uncharacterized protein si:ch211-266a5.12 [Triplophysa rosa]KAI7791849.1 hypothetical protein IRJ41_010611 [Triplophysa rosa]
MAGALQYVCLLLTFAVPIHECVAVRQDPKCVTGEPCFDLGTVEMMARRVSKDLIDADGENILIKHNSFDKIRKKKDLHSCVLQKILYLFEHVLIRTEGKSSTPNEGDLDHHLELIHIMDRLRNCVYKVKNGCKKLYEKAYNQSDITPLPKKSEATEAAIEQLQKLKYASERLDDVKIQERVMDELKSLHLYMPGKGFRKKLND